MELIKDSSLKMNSEQICAAVDSNLRYIMEFYNGLKSVYFVEIDGTCYILKRFPFDKSPLENFAK